MFRRIKHVIDDLLLVTGFGTHIEAADVLLRLLILTAAAAHSSKTDLSKEL